MKKILLFLILFCALSLMGISCGKQEPDIVDVDEFLEPTVILNEEPIISADATIYDAAITAVYEKAQKASKEWQEDAQLIMVSVKIPSDYSLNNSTITYTYGSASVGNLWWTYSYSEASEQYVRALVYKDDYLGGGLNTPLNKEFWRTNYIEALQIADQFMGSSFRANNPNTTTTLTLMNSEPKGWLWWTVEYNTPVGTSDIVRINPHDRSIADEAGNVVNTYQPQLTDDEIIMYEDDIDFDEDFYMP